MSSEDFHRWTNDEGELDLCGDISTACLPDGSHIIYCQTQDNDGVYGLAYKVVRSHLDLQQGNWHIIPPTLARKPS